MTIKIKLIFYFLHLAIGKYKKQNEIYSSSLTFRLMNLQVKS